MHGDLEGMNDVEVLAEPLGDFVPHHPPKNLGGLVVVALLGTCVWALATTDPAAPPTGADATSLGNLGVVTRAFLVSVVLFVGLGLLGDARPAAIRARRRLAITRPTPSR